MGSTTVRATATGIRPALRNWFDRGRRLLRADAALAVVVLVTAVVAVAAHAAYRENLGVRFASLYHDRNAHYQTGLNVACELRQGHLVTAVRDLDAGTMVWPLFHPTCLAAVLTVVGPRPEAAVLPSLVGWCAATLLAFLIVRRLGGQYGDAGGLVAVAMFLGSPALQALATDVMLESLGLCLTLGAILAYLSFAENLTRRTGTALGMVLACLFLHKYNYWVLVVLSVGTTEALRRPRGHLTTIRTTVRMVDWSAWARAQFARPLNYPIAALLGVSLTAWLVGGLSAEVAGRRLEVRDPRILVSIAYSLFLVRLAAWWWPAGRTATAAVLGEPAVWLLKWAAIPPLVWLLLPFRLKTFFWFSSAANALPLPEQSLVEGLQYYLDGFTREYHVAPSLAFVASALAVVGGLALLVRRGSPPGRLAVIVTFLLSAALAVKHPNHQLRFLHTWAPLLWVAAGVGFAVLLAQVARHAGAVTARGVGVVGVAGVSVALVQFTPAFACVSPAFGRGYHPADASLRELHDAYLPFLDGREPTAIFCNRPDAAWRWPFMEHFGHKNGLRHNMREVGAFDPVTPDGAAKWLAATECTTVVYVEIPPTSPLFEPTFLPADNSAILPALKSQDRFRLAHRVCVRDLGTAWLWKR